MIKTDCKNYESCNYNKNIFRCKLIGCNISDCLDCKKYVKKIDMEMLNKLLGMTQLELIAIIDRQANGIENVGLKETNI